MKNKNLILVLLLFILLATSFNLFNSSYSNGNENHSNYDSEQASISSVNINDIGTLMHVQKSFSYQATTDSSIEEIAKELLIQMMEELKIPEENRSYTIVKYKDFDFSLIDKYSDESYLKLKGIELSENMWYLDSSVSVTYQGIISPIGSHTIVPQNEYVEVPLGERIIVKNEQTYTIHKMSKYFNDTN